MDGGWTRAEVAEPGSLVDYFLLLHVGEGEAGCEATELAALAKSKEQHDSWRDSQMRQALPKLYTFTSYARKQGQRFFLPLTLTDELAHKWFAYSLMVPAEEGAALIVVALSRLGRCITGMGKLLENLVELCSVSPESASRLMQWVLTFAPYPLPGLAYNINLSFAGSGGALPSSKMMFQHPTSSNILPSSAEAHFFKLMQVLGIQGLFDVWIRALLEQRIVFTTSRQGPAAACYLAICSEALLLLLQPMKWQGIYIPFVPDAMAALLEAPTPYIIGIAETGLRQAELDDDIVIVNLDNGRIVLPAGLRCTVPEILQEKLDMIAFDLLDPLQAGLVPADGCLKYSLEDIKKQIYTVRRCFGCIMKDVISSTVKVKSLGISAYSSSSSGGGGGGPGADMNDASRAGHKGKTRSSERIENMFHMDFALAKERLHDSLSFTPGTLKNVFKGLGGSDSGSSCSSHSHRRSSSWDQDSQKRIYEETTRNTMNIALNADIDNDGKEKNMDQCKQNDLRFYGEVYETQMFQDLLCSSSDSSGFQWPTNWPECVDWDLSQLEARHVAGNSCFTFDLEMPIESCGHSDAADEIRVASSIESSVSRAFEIGLRLCSAPVGCKGHDLHLRMFVSDPSSTQATGAETPLTEVGFGWTANPQEKSSQEDQQQDFPETSTGEPVAIYASFLELHSSYRSRFGLNSPNKQQALSPFSPVANKSGSPRLAHIVSSSSTQDYNYLDYYEQALEVGVQTYTVIPKIRLYQLIQSLDEHVVGTVESCLGPNLCMLLESTRGSNETPKSSDASQLDSGMCDNHPHPKNVLQSPTLAYDVLGFHLEDGANVKPLNLVHKPTGGGNEAKPSRRADEMMLVCISTAKMLITIQSNKKSRQFIDADDIVAVANSSEYTFLSVATSELEQADPSQLNDRQRAIFFINLYNLMVLHGALEKARASNRHNDKFRWLPQASPFGWIKFLKSTVYNVGGLLYSALDVEHSVLRTTRIANDDLFIGRLLPHFLGDDPRMKCKILQPVPLLTFALCPGTVCSPPIKCFREHDFDQEVQSSARIFLEKYCRAELREKMRRPYAGEAKAMVSTRVLEVHFPVSLKRHRYDIGRGKVSDASNQNRWLLSIAKLMSAGSKVAKSITEALEQNTPVVIKYDSYKWELGWMLHES